MFIFSATFIASVFNNDTENVVHLIISNNPKIGSSKFAKKAAFNQQSFVLFPVFTALRNLSLFFNQVNYIFSVYRNFQEL